MAGSYPVHLSSVSLKKISKRKRGRPRKIKLLPKDPVTAQIDKERQDHFKGDNLLKLLANKPNSLDVMDMLMFELAREASSLQFERMEAERLGLDTTIISSKKVTALKGVSDIYFRKRDAILGQAFDLKSTRFSKFIEWLLSEVVAKAAREANLTSEQISILFDHIANAFDNEKWDQEALLYIKAE